MALEWSLKLKDGMSGPTQKAADALSVLDKRLKAVKGSSALMSKQFDKAPPKFSRWSESIGKLFGGKAAKGLQRVQDDLGKTLFGNVSYGDALAGAASAGLAIGAAFAAAFAAAVAAVVGIVANITGQIATFQQAKAKTLFAFDKLLGPGGSTKAWDAIRAAADKTKTPIQETAQAFNNLVAAGFKLDQADVLFRQLADLKTLNPQANIDGIVRAIGQIRNIGKLQGDELNQLSEAGVNVDDVYSELSKRLGKTRDEVMKLKEAGKIKADDAIAAIQASIAKRTGGDPGAVAGKAPKTAAESWERLKQKFFDMVNMDFGPLTAFLDRLEQALDGEGGQALASAFEEIASAAGEILDSFTTEDLVSGMKGAAEVVKSIADSLRDIAALSRAVNGTLGDTGTIATLTGVWGALKGIGKALLSTILGPLAFLGDAIDVVAGIGTAFTEAVLWIKAQAPVWLEAALSLGQSVIDGIMAGISAAAGALYDQVAGVGASVRQAFGDAIGEGSPARAFIPAGVAIDQGVGVGVEQGESALRAQVAGMAASAKGAAAGAVVNRSVVNNSTRGGDRNVTIHSTAFDPTQQDQRMRQIVRQEMRAAQA